jgi:hypothetical protein
MTTVPRSTTAHPDYSHIGRPKPAASALDGVTVAVSNDYYWLRNQFVTF